MIKSWQFYSAESSPIGRFYEWLRRRLNEKLVRFLSHDFQNAHATANSKAKLDCVLEAGSGTAYASSLFRQREGVAQTVCLDLDLEALREAKARDPGLTAVIGDLRAMPFRESAFDLVFNSSTIEHLDHPEDAAREMRRVCRPAGRVFIGVPYLFGPLGFQPMISRTSLGIWLGRVFSKSSLERMMHSAGLRPIASIRYFVCVFLGIVATRDDALIELKQT